MNFRKHAVAVVFIFSLMILISGCNKESEETLNANQIISLDKNNIKAMNITVGGGSTVEISDKIVIEKVIDDVNNLKVKKISLDENTKVMENGNKLSKDTTLVFQLLKDKGMNTNISLILFSEKELVIADQKTVPSISYLNADDQTTLNSVENLYALLFPVFNENKVQ